MQIIKKTSKKDTINNEPSKNENKKKIIKIKKKEDINNFNNNFKNFCNIVETDISNIEINNELKLSNLKLDDNKKLEIDNNFKETINDFDKTFNIKENNNSQIINLNNITKKYYVTLPIYLSDCSLKKEYNPKKIYLFATCFYSKYNRIFEASEDDFDDYSIYENNIIYNNIFKYNEKISLKIIIFDKIIEFNKNKHEWFHIIHMYNPNCTKEIYNNIYDYIFCESNKFKYNTFNNIKLNIDNQLIEEISYKFIYDILKSLKI